MIATRQFKIFSFILLICGFGLRAQAFPEMVRHGYNNCVTCHVSPTGGGTLSAYGRQLSREVLSSWSNEGEEQFAYGLFSMPEWLAAGGDFRALQYYQDTPTARSANYIVMQDDLEAAVTVGSFTADATLGLQNNPGGPPPQGDLFSRRYYLMYKPLEEVSLRAGQFLPAFGINTDDHEISIKQFLQFDQNMETWNVEGAYLGDTADLYLTAIFGRPDYPTLERQKGYSAVASYYFGERYKAGASFYYGSNDTQSQYFYGPWAILGFTPHFFTLAELDYTATIPTGVPPIITTEGLVDYLRVDYELVQGFHLFLTQEVVIPDFTNAATSTRTYGAGIQFFPRPHFELQGMWQKKQVLAQGDGLNDYLYLMAHFYP